MKERIVFTAKSGNSFQSTAIFLLTYDPDHNSLGVVFQSDPQIVYLYEKVEESVMLQLLNASSLGAFVNRNVRSTYAFKVLNIESYLNNFRYHRDMYQEMCHFLSLTS